MFRNRIKKLKIVDMRSVIDFDDLEQEEVSFLEEIIRPELAKYTPKQQMIILNRFKAVVENRKNYESLFPVDKEYDRELIKVCGVRKVGAPSELTRQLVLGIISRKEHLLQESFEFYQEDVLRNIRASIRPERIFNRVNGHLKGKPTPENASGILDTLNDTSVQSNRALGDIVNFLRKGLADPSSLEGYKSLVARLNKRTINLSRSHGRFGSCAFWGTGEQSLEHQLDLSSRYHTSVLYLADPEIGLLFDHVEDKHKLDIPTGAVIMASMLSKQPYESTTCEERTLLIDSTEAYRPDYDSRFPNNPLREMKNDIWRRINYNSILKIAEDIDATRLFYNPHFWNEGGNTFTNYFLKRANAEGLNVEEQTLHLRKEGGRKYIPNYYWDPFGFFIDCLIPQDSKNFCGEHAIKGSYDGKGTATGWVVDIKCKPSKSKRGHIR